MNTLDNMQLVGSGMSADIYKIEDNKVLKLFKAEYGNEVPAYEGWIMECVNKLNINAPHYYGMKTINDRVGVIYDYIDGKSLINVLMKNPLSIAGYGKLLAKEQYAINQKKVDGLLNEKERFKNQIERSKGKLGAYYAEVLNDLENKAKENYVCHGDFHPGNIMMQNGKPVVIDWMNAYSGTRAGDAARSYMMIISPNIPDVFRGVRKILLKIVKRKLARSFIKEYIRLSNISFGEIREWMKIIAAVRLCDNVPNEEEWLLDIIRGNT